MTRFRPTLDALETRTALSYVMGAGPYFDPTEAGIMTPLPIQIPGYIVTLDSPPLLWGDYYFKTPDTPYPDPATAPLGGVIILVPYYASPVDPA